MPLELFVKQLSDPTGHNPALLLRGDWVMLGLSDGKYCGWGEASHSKNDALCIETAKTIFKTNIKDMELTLDAIHVLEQQNCHTVESFIHATAISGLNQALYALVALREDKPCHRLLYPDATDFQPPHVYATINRALTTRDEQDYLSTIEQALKQGFNAIKCAPFEMVTPQNNQLSAPQDGLDKLQSIRKHFPALSIRVDFHERFQLSLFLDILPQLLELNLYWVEAPLPINHGYTSLRKECDYQMALGELFYGLQGFTDIINYRWADIIMPDVKHVGGFGPLSEVIKAAPSHIRVSPHNPSGPIATLASLHACQTNIPVDSLELPLILDPERAYYLPYLRSGHMQLDAGPAWGHKSLSLLC